MDNVIKGCYKVGRRLFTHAFLIIDYKDIVINTMIDFECIFKQYIRTIPLIGDKYELKVVVIPKFNKENTAKFCDSLERAYKKVLYAGGSSFDIIDEKIKKGEIKI